MDIEPTDMFLAAIMLIFSSGSTMQHNNPTCKSRLISDSSNSSPQQSHLQKPSHLGFVDLKPTNMGPQRSPDLPLRGGPNPVEKNLIRKVEAGALSAAGHNPPRAPAPRSRARRFRRKLPSLEEFPGLCTRAFPQYIMVGAISLWSNNRARPRSAR